MNHLYIFLGLCMTPFIVHGQLAIKYDDDILLLTDVYKPDTVVYYDQAVVPDDKLEVALFKQYFNPGILEKYKLFFLPQDWFGATNEQFNEWQANIKKVRLRLSHIFYLESLTGARYLVIDYLMEDNEYIIPASSEFKWIDGKWKHTSLQNDELGPMLSKIGDFHPDYFTSYLEKNSRYEIDLINERFLELWKPVEKFNRDTLFNHLIPLLSDRNISSQNIEELNLIFMEKNDSLFITLLEDEFDIDIYEFMDEANALIGFKLFQYAHSLNK